MSNGLLIIAEDNAILRKLYSDFLESSGFTVVTANNGRDALHLLQSVRPKVLILDIMMPEMDGIETCRQVRKQLGSSLPIIFLTASDELNKLDDCMRAGGNDYLLKTGALDYILTRIRYWARPTSTWSNEYRRDQALAAVSKAVIEEEARGQEQHIELTSKTDDTLRQMSEFVLAAQAQAPRDFGSTVDQKLYLLGYVTGVVDHWSSLSPSMRPRYLDYLRSVLKETAILETREIDKMMESYEDLADQTIFRLAWEWGQRESEEAVGKKSEFVSIGLAEFENAIAV
ncbi:MAG: response regulator [Nitrospiraceae bacterium]